MEDTKLELPRKAKTKRMKKEWRKSTEVTEHNKKKIIKKLELQEFQQEKRKEHKVYLKQ